MGNLFPRISKNNIDEIEGFHSGQVPFFPKQNVNQVVKRATAPHLANFIEWFEQHPLPQPQEHDIVKVNKAGKPQEMIRRTFLNINSELTNAKHQIKTDTDRGIENAILDASSPDTLLLKLRRINMEQHKLFKNCVNGGTECVVSSLSIWHILQLHSRQLDQNPPQVLCNIMMVGELTMRPWDSVTELCPVMPSIRSYMQSLSNLLKESHCANSRCTERSSNRPQNHPHCELYVPVIKGHWRDAGLPWSISILCTPGSRHPARRDEGITGFYPLPHPTTCEHIRDSITDMTPNGGPSWCLYEFTPLTSSSNPPPLLDCNHSTN
ncbi:hypothetical protein Pelo_12982 [Pelomyxa schiedti]|nr:hypothetical protein Pelo_12982 [Pelomyxa schiedti]